MCSSLISKNLNGSGRTHGKSIDQGQCQQRARRPCWFSEPGLAWPIFFPTKNKKKKNPKRGPAAPPRISESGPVQSSPKLPGDLPGTTGLGRSPSRYTDRHPFLDDVPPRLFHVFVHSPVLLEAPFWRLSQRLPQAKEGFSFYSVDGGGLLLLLLVKLFAALHQPAGRLRNGTRFCFPQQAG